MTQNLMTWEEAVKWFIAQPENAAIAKAAYFDDPIAGAKRYHASAEFAEILGYLPDTPGRALDLGAGNGILSYALAQEGWDVTAIEPDPSAFVGAGAIRHVAAKTGTDIRVVEAFGEDLPLETAGFDIVVARQVLHHARDLPAFCKELSRLSRDGAKIVTLRDHVITGPDQMSEFLNSHSMHYLYGGENAFTILAYREALQGAGLTITEELNSFDSVINYDPNTPSTIRDMAAERFGGLKPIAKLALSCVPFPVLTKLLAKIDNRPGRMVSFICEKPARI